MTKEHKRKIGIANSIALRRNIPWNKGLKKGEHPSLEKIGFKKGHPIFTTKSQFKKGHIPTHGFKKRHIPWNKNTHIWTGGGVKKGNVPWNKGIHTGIKPWLGKKRFNISNENNYAWKGENVSIDGLHKWVDRKKIKPQRCSHCYKIKRLFWANVDHRYKRILKDYIALCASCHTIYDIKHNNKLINPRNEKGQFYSAIQCKKS